MTTMTDSEVLAVLDCLVDSYPDWERYSPGAVRLARAHIAEALMDARRYRALIDSGSYSPGVRNHGGCPWGLRMSGSPFSKAGLDAAIDAAIKDDHA